MKTLILTILMAFMATPVMAAEGAHEHLESWLKPVEAKFVCMMNNKLFDKEQMAIEIEGKTYYGCCPMCKEMLQKAPEKRSAVDPVSGKAVDKAAAVIGADAHGMTYYFENAENFQKYANSPMPEMKHDMDDMHNHMKDMHDMKAVEPADTAKNAAPVQPSAETSKHKDHH